MLDHFQCYSRAYASRIIKLHRMRPATYVYCPIGLPEDVTCFPIWQQPAHCQPLEIAFWGVAGPFHGIDLLAVVAHKLKARNIRAKLNCYTPHTETAELLLRRAAELGVSEMFHVCDHAVSSTGFREVLGSHAAISHLIQAPVLDDANAALCAVYSNKMLEILAMGMPLIVADTPATREIVDSECAILVSPGGVDSIVEAMARIATDPKWTTEIAKRGRDRVHLKMSAGAVSKMIQNDLRSLGSRSSSQR